MLTYVFFSFQCILVINIKSPTDNPSTTSISFSENINAMTTKPLTTTEKSLEILSLCFFLTLKTF